MGIRVFYASDIHGSEVCFRKFLNAIKIYRVDVAILGGDLTGKLLIPVIKINEKQYEADFAGRRWIIREEEELKRLLKMIRDSGYYPRIMSEDEYHKAKSDATLIKRLFDEAIAEVMREWIRLAEEKLREINVECYIMPGNDDSRIIDEILKESERIINPDERVLEIKGGFEMLSLGASNPTPWKTPREYTEEELEDKLASLLSHVKNPETAIFNIHVPPYETLLDMAPLLDENLRVVTKGGRIVFVHVGSKAVRRVIEKNQPLISLHGHIHESKGVDKIGRTLCFNPGSEYSEGFLRGVLVNLEKGKVKNYLFTYG
jgi:Icc-related predicted phosphoesterase